MELSFTTEQKLIQENIIGFAKKELNNNIIERDKNQQFLPELWKKCAEHKLTGLPVEQNVFVPFIRKLFPCFLAVVLILKTSEPDSLSVIAFTAIFFPLHKSGKYFFF